MSPTEGMQMNQTILQLCLKTSTESTENGVLSGIHAYLKYISSAVYLHPSKYVIKGLVKGACLVFFFIFFHFFF